MESDTEDCIAVWEFQIGKCERLVKLLRSHAGKPLSKFLADFLVTLVDGKPSVKRGRPRKMLSQGRDYGLAQAVARYRQKHGLSYEDAVLQVAEDTGYSDSTIKRAVRKHSPQVQ
jgi:hypothetical protein